jgi:hypothetical protein
VVIAFVWVTWPLQWLEVHFRSLFCTWLHRKLPRALQRLDQYAIIIVMHCQWFWPSNSPDQRKLRNQNLVYKADTEDYLTSHAWTKLYISKLFIMLLLHSFSHDWNQLWASILLEVLGRRRRGDTFWVEIFIKQGFLPNKTCFLVSNPWIEFIGLESVDVVLVNVETEQVETRAPGNLVAIFLLSWISMTKH